MKATEVPDEYRCVFKDEIWTVKVTNHTRKLSVSWFMVFTIRMEMRSSIWTHMLLACWMHKDPHVACLLDAQGSPPRVYTILLLGSRLFKVYFVCVSPVKDQQLLFADSVVLVGYRSKLENNNALNLSVPPLLRSCFSNFAHILASNKESSTSSKSVQRVPTSCTRACTMTLDVRWMLLEKAKGI